MYPGFFRGIKEDSDMKRNEYVRQYINDFFIVAEQGDCIHIGKDLPDEYVWSEYTKKLRGMLAKAKANAAQGIPEMI